MAMMVSVSRDSVTGVMGSGFMASGLSEHLQVVTLNQGARGQGAGVREESCLHVQPTLGQCGVAAGRRTHLLGLWGVCLLVLVFKTQTMKCIT